MHTDIQFLESKNSLQSCTKRLNRWVHIQRIVQKTDTVVTYKDRDWQRNTLYRQQKLQNLYYLALKSCSRNPARLRFMAWCELLTVITQKNYATYTHAHGYFKAKIQVKSTGFWEAGDARAFVNFLANTWQRNTLSRQQKLQNLYYLTLKSCSRNPARLLFMAWCKLLTVITQKNYATCTRPF